MIPPYIGQRMEDYYRRTGQTERLEGQIASNKNAEKIYAERAEQVSQSIQKDLAEKNIIDRIYEVVHQAIKTLKELLPF